MGLWSKIKKAAKKVWQGAKSIVRQIVKVAIEIVKRFFNIYNVVLGFTNWPKKKLRVHVYVLSDENGESLMDYIDNNGNPVTRNFSQNDLALSIAQVKRTLKDRFNVELIHYSGSRKSSIQVITEKAPTAALDVRCEGGAWLDEIGEAGNFFAKYLVGWNAVPVSLAFPITVFVVRDIKGANGCSLNILSDYVTISPDGVKDAFALAHEIGHACGLWHSRTKSNLMYKKGVTDNKVKWFQKNLFRSSRHVQYL